jgi:hypothetical protein
MGSCLKNEIQMSSSQLVLCLKKEIQYGHVVMDFFHFAISPHHHHQSKPENERTTNRKTILSGSVTIERLHTMRGKSLDPRAGRHDFQMSSCLKNEIQYWGMSSWTFSTWLRIIPQQQTPGNHHLIAKHRQTQCPSFRVSNANVALRHERAAPDWLTAIKSHKQTVVRNTNSRASWQQVS